MKTKTKKFLGPIQSWSANFGKNCSPNQSWSGQNWLQSWSVLISGSRQWCSRDRNLRDRDLVKDSRRDRDFIKNSETRDL